MYHSMCAYITCYDKWFNHHQKKRLKNNWYLLVSNMCAICLIQSVFTLQLTSKVHISFHYTKMGMPIIYTLWCIYFLFISNSFSSRKRICYLCLPMLRNHRWSKFIFVFSQKFSTTNLNKGEYHSIFFPAMWQSACSVMQALSVFKDTIWYITLNKHLWPVFCCCGHVIRHGWFMWFICPYFSGLFHWHWLSHMVASEPLKLTRQTWERWAVTIPWQSTNHMP